MLYINLFQDGEALLETVPQGEASIRLNLPDATVEALAAMLTCDSASAALARLFLTGCTAGERAVRR